MVQLKKHQSLKLIKRKITRKLKYKDQIEQSRNPRLLFKWNYNEGSIEINPRAQLEIDYY